MFEDRTASSNIKLDGQTTEESLSKDQQQVLGVLRCGQSHSSALVQDDRRLRI